MATKYDFKEISVMWRPSRGHSRICIGSLRVSKDGTLSFVYSPKGLEKATEVDPDFKGYPGLPPEINHYSSEQISKVFFGRLIDSSRSDAVDFYDFWLVDKDKIDDDLYVLAQTQGLSLTDMFEFVPQYYVSHKQSFITDVAGLSKSDFDLSLLKKGDRVFFVLEKDNPIDKDAVQITFKGNKIGYIKKGHNAVFQRKSSKRITLTVSSITTLPGFEKLYLRVDLP